MTATNHPGSLSVTRFWLFQGSRWNDDGARVELTDGSQHVVTLSPGGVVNGLPYATAFTAIRDAIAESVVPHAIATADDSSPLCQGWDKSFEAADHAADVHYAATHGEAA